MTGRPADMLERPAIDTLSDVLRAVRLSGAVDFDVTATPPWVAEAPPAREIAGTVLPGAQHVIEYHAVVRGTAWATLLHPPMETVELAEGDLVRVPHGDAHVMSSDAGMRGTASAATYARPADVPLPIVWNVGDPEGGAAHVVCGFIGCDARPFNPLIDALPRMLRICDRGANGGTLRQFAQLARAEARARRPGSESVLSKLSELLFVEGVQEAGRDATRGVAAHPRSRLSAPPGSHAWTRAQWERKLDGIAG